MICKPPFIIETNANFKEDCLQLFNAHSHKWQDSNELYSNYISRATSGKSMQKFFVSEIKPMSFQCKKLIVRIFNLLKIKPKDFRVDFFKVLPGGELPIHVDQKSLISVCIPITENTASTYFEFKNKRHEVSYENLIVLNNKIPHGVNPPTDTRIIFRIGIHDINFEELQEGLGLNEIPEV